jgi:hypothetical protein
MAWNRDRRSRDAFNSRLDPAAMMIFSQHVLSPWAALVDALSCYFPFVLLPCSGGSVFADVAQHAPGEVFCCGVCGWH